MPDDELTDEEIIRGDYLKENPWMMGLSLAPEHGGTPLASALATVITAAEEIGYSGDHVTLAETRKLLWAGRHLLEIAACD